jgi:hypothetical protein
MRILDSATSLQSASNLVPGADDLWSNRRQAMDQLTDRERGFLLGCFLAGETCLSTLSQHDQARLGDAWQQAKRRPRDQRRQLIRALSLALKPTIEAMLQQINAHRSGARSAIDQALAQEPDWLKTLLDRALAGNSSPATMSALETAIVRSFLQQLIAARE